MSKNLIGVFIPTTNRPDFIRQTILQIQNQSQKPHIVVVHQNGNNESYEWAVKDLKINFEIVWIHTKKKLANAHLWYLPALHNLILRKCDSYFWMDHDDIYLRDHIKEGQKVLKINDFGINKICGRLILDSPPKYEEQTKIPHAPGGMTSSMCFNYTFAKDLMNKLLLDLKSKNPKKYPDQILAEMLPKYKVGFSKKVTTVYVCHSKTVSSYHWLESHKKQIIRIK